LGGLDGLASGRKRAVAIVNGASAAVGIELNHTGSINANSNADESGVLLSTALSQNVAVGILHGAGLGAAAKVALAVESELAVPAVALDGELAAATGVKARRVSVGVALVVDGFAVVTDDGEALVVARSATFAVGSGDGAE